ncbi:Competence-specific nuclease [Lachnospira eligens]|uniref:Competence-specific nuclease n=1 Tax=Lachnospira eligens TaxID=39485 RepID=A0A174YRQ5_9FIRM|nr:DNA/RNA non-specific endonuclease [Lachnospira eligens]CUQ74686.1 Competence-specific nuclease [Lachnospira eligens]
MRNSRLEILRRITAFLLIFFIVGSVPGLSGCSSKKAGNSGAAASVSAQTDMASFAYDGKPYVVINDNDPDFTDADMTTTSFERYGELDGLGRCTTAFANIGKDLMPAEKRGPIGEVKPTGWQTDKYDNVDGKYLYNRCHLIGYQLTGENANEKNLITGTRYLNVDGMLPFENMVADYIKETNNHVLYRVTPVFSGDNLVASGVHMEAESVEDNGDGILFNVYCFNAQPGIAIDYATGDSHQDDSIVADASKSTTAAEANVQTYVLNTNTKKFHKESCNSAKSMDASNKKIYTGSRQEIIDMGYEACGVCKP